MGRGTEFSSTGGAALPISAPPVDAITIFSTPASRAQFKTLNVPTTLFSKFSAGSITESTTDPAAARWITVRTPAIASFRAPGLRISPRTIRTSATSEINLRLPRLRLSNTRTSPRALTKRRTRFEPIKPHPPVTNTGPLGTICRFPSPDNLKLHIGRFGYSCRLEPTRMQDRDFITIDFAGVAGMHHELHGRIFPTISGRP